MDRFSVWFRLGGWRHACFFISGQLLRQNQVRLFYNFVRSDLNFIRFSIQERDADSGHATGILVAGHTLRDEGDLGAHEHQQLRELLAWFNERLMLPEGLDDISTKRAISWFKPAADEFIRKMWELKSVLEHHGFHVSVLKTTTPGTVIYEDDDQVVAVPPKGVRF